MSMRQRLATTAIAVTIFVGCGSSSSNPPLAVAAPPTPAVPASSADLNALIAEKGKATFLSHDGNWVGTDVDWEIQFMAEGVVHLTHYGDAVSHFIGTYRIDDKGRIEMTFKETKWPPMLLKRDSKSLLLEFAEGEQLFGKPFRPYERK